jgi:hypothetical protein
VAVHRRGRAVERGARRTGVLAPPQHAHVGARAVERRRRRERRVDPGREPALAAVVDDDDLVAESAALELAQEGGQVRREQIARVEDRDDDRDGLHGRSSARSGFTQRSARSTIARARSR